MVGTTRGIILLPSPVGIHEPSLNGEGTLEDYQRYVRAVDIGSTTILIALDLDIFFDTIDHSILLNRLESSFGVTGPARPGAELNGVIPDNHSFACWCIDSVGSHQEPPRHNQHITDI